MKDSAPNAEKSRSAPPKATRGDLDPAKWILRFMEGIEQRIPSAVDADLPSLRECWALYTEWRFTGIRNAFKAAYDSVKAARADAYKERQHAKDIVTAFGVQLSELTGEPDNVDQYVRKVREALELDTLRERALKILARCEERGTDAAGEMNALILESLNRNPSRSGLPEERGSRSGMPGMREPNVRDSGQ